MSYNRTLDLLAMCLAHVQAGQPVKAASFMHEAATDPSAKAAVDAIFAANKKKKPAKKKAKASSVFAELDLEEDEDLDADDTVASLRAALEDGEDDDTVECETEDEDTTFHIKSARIRAARRALADALADDSDEDDVETSSDAEDEKNVFTLKSARSTQAGADDITMGEDLREEVPATRSKASFARALRNIAARQG